MERPMRGSARFALALAALPLIACSTYSHSQGSNATARAASILNVAELDSVISVDLGMTAQELRGARPVSPAPYVGYREEIAGSPVFYHFPGATGSLDDVISLEGASSVGQGSLVAVEVRREAASSDDAAHMWFRSVERLLRLQQQRVTCMTYAHGVTPSAAAFLQQDGHVIGVIGYAEIEERDMFGSIDRPAFVRYFVSDSAARFIPDLANRVPAPCSPVAGTPAWTRRARPQDLGR